jgi:protoporphyrinogen IX oxidase
MLYLWLKALHIIAIIAWMAGMLYLPRLFVYHVDAPKGSAQSETFKIMEKRLLRLIINPAMVASIILGLGMIALDPSLLSQGWMHAKLTLVIGMIVLHIFLARWRRAFENDQNRHSARFFRIINEVPTLLMIGIVILVVIKPF